MNYPMLLLGLLFTCAFGFGAKAGEVPAEDILGKKMLLAIYQEADVILVGRVSMADIGIAHGGKLRYGLTIEVSDVLKGNETNRLVKAVAVKYPSHDRSRRVPDRSNCIVFLTSELETVDPWFSIQLFDSNLRWAIGQIAARDSRRP